MNGLFEYVDDKPRRGDVSLAVLLSMALHITALIWIATHHFAQAEGDAAEPVRYVQIVPELSQQFTEAPGPKTEREPRPDAPLSDADRKAMTPNPTGAEPTDRPGDARGIYDGGPRGLPPVPQAQAQAPAAEQVPETAESGKNEDAPAVERDDAGIQPYRESQQSAERKTPDVDWKQALQQMQNGAQQQSPRIGRFDAGGSIGGDLGTAETGPLSFESNWFEWGDYAAKMIARIRVHWYENMPELIRMGVKGMVTIRFTIQRNGTITDIQILESSGIPPYDNAAVVALQQASPLAPLPENFPKQTERVTARFLYNLTPPQR